MKFDAVILAGGAGRRLGGIDKAAITVGDATLLDRVLAAVVDADQIICVGPQRDAAVELEWVREDPPGGGPVAALAAGLQRVHAPVVMLLAVDLPFVTPTAVRRMVAVCNGGKAVIAADPDGVPQPLLAAYPTKPLQARVAALGDGRGVPMKRLMDRLPHSLLVEPGICFDCDSWADVEQAVARANSWESQDS